MPVRDFSSEQARQELRELTGYEDWLLQHVYKLTEDELFPEWPDAVVYDADTKSSVVRNSGRGNAVLLDWRPGSSKSRHRWSLLRLSSCSICCSSGS